MSRELETAKEAAVSAGRKILEIMQRGAVVKQKDASQSHNLVSDADLAAEECIVGMLRAAFPSHAFLAEESHRDRLDAPALWVIDPLDGTSNFAHGFPMFCTSVGLAVDGEFRVGVVYDATRDELFWAEKGHGAFCNGRPVRVSTVATLRESLIATGFFYDRDLLLRRTLEAIHALFQAGIHGIRRTGSAALDLCYVGCGRLEGFFEYRLMPWDFAAGAVFIREAGGCATDTHGAPLTPHALDVLASNGRVHPALLALLARYRPDVALAPAERLDLTR